MAKLGSKVSNTFVADLTNGFVDPSQTGIVLVTFTDADTTPTVAASNSFLASNTAPTSITNFDNGVEGQVIRVQFTNANTTIVHDVTKIKLASGANVTPAANTALAFTLDATGIWWQVGGSGGGASFATPAIVLGSSASGGAASTVIRSDSTIAAFDATNPATSNPSDAVAVGSAAFAARRDHKHAREGIIYLFDDFIVNFGSGNQASVLKTSDNAWYKQTNGSSDVTSDAGDYGASVVGTVKFLSGTTNLNGASLTMDDGATVVGNSIYTTKSGLMLQFRFMPGKLDSSAFTRAMLFMGLTASTTYPDTGTSSNDQAIIGFWDSDDDYAVNGEGPIAFASTKNGASQTYTVFGTPSSYKGAFHTGAIELVDTGHIKFYIDGTLVATHTSNLPSSSSALQVRFSLHTRASASPAVAQASYLDWVMLNGKAMDRGAILY